MSEAFFSFGQAFLHTFKANGGCLWW